MHEKLCEMRNGSNTTLGRNESNEERPLGRLFIMEVYRISGSFFYSFQSKPVTAARERGVCRPVRRRSPMIQVG